MSGDSFIAANDVQNEAKKEIWKEVFNLFDQQYEAKRAEVVMDQEMVLVM